MGRSKEAIRLAKKRYNEKNKLKIKVYQREYKKVYQEKNKEKIKQYQKEYRGKNKEKIKQYQKTNISQKEYFRLKIKEYRASYSDEKKKQINLQKKLYREKNKERLVIQQKNWYRNQMRTNPFFKLKANIRTLIGNSFRRNGYKKTSKTEQILGCSYDEFKLHLEKQFEPWMNWDNRGLYNGTENYGWDIDHIIPLDTAKTEEDIIRLNHYSNLQPLCSHINRDIKKHKN